MRIVVAFASNDCLIRSFRKILKNTLFFVVWTGLRRVSCLAFIQNGFGREGAGQELNSDSHCGGLPSSVGDDLDSQSSLHNIRYYEGYVKCWCTSIVKRKMQLDARSCRLSHVIYHFPPPNPFSRGIMFSWFSQDVFLQNCCPCCHFLTGNLMSFLAPQ